MYRRKVITVLSIDGGEVRGLIPAKILDALETYIQEEEGNENARLADYFDFIAGISTGGLITAMLTTSDCSSESKRPFTAKQIVEFYHTEGRKIFPNKLVHELKQQAVHKRWVFDRFYYRKIYHMSVARHINWGPSNQTDSTQQRSKLT
ncbi:hypothetical protein PTKIN_Ptkin06aG0206700 [Pterospermum kingtungense]